MEYTVAPYLQAPEKPHPLNSITGTVASSCLKCWCSWCIDGIHSTLYFHLGADMLCVRTDHMRFLSEKITHLTTRARYKACRCTIRARALQGWFHVKLNRARHAGRRRKTRGVRADMLRFLFPLYPLPQVPFTRKIRVSTLTGIRVSSTIPLSSVEVRVGTAVEFFFLL